MNRKRKLIFVLLSFLLISKASAAGELRVVRVTSGDTLEAVADHMKITVRLVGIDAPEPGRKENVPAQSFGKTAADFLASMVFGKIITIKDYGNDPGGGIRAVVFFNGKNANLEMVKAGLAEVSRGTHPRYFNAKLYQEAQAAARNDQRGMWIQGDTYISPREWRRMHRNQ